MKKRVAFILVWTVAFPLICMIFWMLVLGIIGLVGIVPHVPPNMSEESMTPLMRAFGALGVTMTVSVWLSPVAGLILGILAKLPGTKRNQIGVKSVYA